MQLGYIGLGKMGSNMVERLLEKKYQVLLYDSNPAVFDSLSKTGGRASSSLQEMTDMMPVPRLLWLMVPYKAVDAVLQELTPLLSSGDVVIDGGNSPYRESMRRAEDLEAGGIDFLDAGVSGGPVGARTGACIMVGGKEAVFRKQEMLFRDLSAENGYAYVGPSGAGHFVKMVHNGIEYGMMQALAEGFTVLRKSSFGLDLAGVAGLYNRRSVIESRLVSWLQDAYHRNGADLKGVSGAAAQSGEGLWTVEAANELGIELPVIKASLDFRIRSQREPNYTGRIISALRHEFGGHDVDEVAKAGGRTAGGGEVVTED